MKRFWLISGLGLVMSIIVAIGAVLSVKMENAKYPTGQESIEKYYKVTRFGIDDAISILKREGLLIKEDIPHQTFHIDPGLYSHLTLDQKRDMGFILYLEASLVLGKAQKRVSYIDGFTGKKLAEYSFDSGFLMEGVK